MYFKKNHYKEDDMRIQYSNEFILNTGLGDPKTCVYQFTFDENDSNYTNIIQYFIMHALVLCIKLYNFVAHIFYAWSFSNNNKVSIDINKNKYFFP